MDKLIDLLRTDAGKLSWTMVANVGLAFLSTVLIAVQAFLPDLLAGISDTADPKTVLLLSVVNAVLRAKTQGPLKGRKKATKLSADAG